MSRRTPTGFITKQLMVELLTDGYVRVLNTRNGQWVEVSQSDRGTKLFVSCGHFEKDALARYLATTPAEGRG